MERGKRDTKGREACNRLVPSLSPPWAGRGEAQSLAAVHCFGVER